MQVSVCRGHAELPLQIKTQNFVTFFLSKQEIKQLFKWHSHFVKTADNSPRSGISTSGPLTLQGVNGDDGQKPACWP